MAYSLLRKKDAESVRPWIKINLFIATVLIFAYFFLLYFGIGGNYKSDHKEGAIYIGFVCLGVATMLAIIVAMNIIF